MSNTERIIHGVRLGQFENAPNDKAEAFRAAVERCPDCPYLQVKLAIPTLLQDEHAHVELASVERVLQEAFAIAPSHLEALDELANFYHAIVPNEEQAKAFARQYVQRTARAHVFMLDILGDEYDRIMKAAFEEAL
jgi:hypothetical protein